MLLLCIIFQSSFLVFTSAFQKADFKTDTEVEQELPGVSPNQAYLWSFDKFKKAAQQEQEGLGLGGNLDNTATAQLAAGLDLLAGFQSLQWPKMDFGKNVETAEMAEETAGKKKWELPKLDFGKNVETVVMTEEEIAEMKKKWELPKFEFSKIEKEVKEVPIYVYKLPPLPKLELPEVKQLPLVLYEMPEIKPLPEMKFPEIRIEKYVLPKFEDVKFPEIKPPKEIPLIMYEFPMPDIKPLDLPKIEPIKEIPIYTFELPPLPEMKPIELPKIKMPEVKVVRKKLPPIPELKPLDLPKLDLPKIKVVKYQMPDFKHELPKLPELKIPEIKFVKHEVELDKKPPKLPEFKLPDFKLPELKPIELPELKLPDFKFPEIKPLELPEFPQYPMVYPMMMPPVQYVYTPAMQFPMPYTYPALTTGQQISGGFKHGFGGLKTKSNLVQKAGYEQRVTGGAEVQGATSSDVGASGDKSGQVVIGSNMASGVPWFNPGLFGHYGYHGPHQFGSDVLVATGNDAIITDEDVAQVYVADGHNGIGLDSFTPWNLQYNLFDPAVHEIPAPWFGAVHGELEKSLSVGKHKVLDDFVNATITGEL